MRKVTVFGIAILLALAAGGFAYASIPDSTGVIHGCYKNSTGRLSVVDSAATCPSGTAGLNWEQTPQIRLVDTAGVADASGNVAKVETFCPAGYIAVSSGFDWARTFDGTFRDIDLTIRTSGPNNGGTSWVSEVLNASSTVAHPFTIQTACVLGSVTGP